MDQIQNQMIQCEEVKQQLDANFQIESLQRQLSVSTAICNVYKNEFFKLKNEVEQKTRELEKHCDDVVNDGAIVQIEGGEFEQEENGGEDGDIDFVLPGSQRKNNL